MINAGARTVLAQLTIAFGLMISLLLSLALIAEANVVVTRIAYWRLDETIGAPYVDSENDHDGLCGPGCPTSNTGHINLAQTFSATVGLDIPADAAFNWASNDSFSIELWAKASSPDTCKFANEVMIGRKDAATGLHWAIGCSKAVGNVQKTRFFLSDTTGITVSLEGPDFETNSERWHHLVGIRDGVNNVTRFFVDSVEVMSSTQSFSGGFASNTADLHIGYLNSAEHFQGMIDEVAIYDGVLSKADIRTHFYLGRGYTNSCDTPINIMPVGDSITIGSFGSGSNGGSGDSRPESEKSGYRGPLYFDLDAVGYDFEFVGQVQAGQAIVPAFDSDLEGYGGQDASWIASQIYGFLETNHPDVLLLHIGTNNLTTNPVNVQAIFNNVNQYEKDYNKSVAIVVARIINRKTHSPDTTTFNSNLQTLADTYLSQGHKILVVDQENALTYPDDMADMHHPNTSGYAKMSDVWLDGLAQFLPICLFPPTIVSSPNTAATFGQAYNYNVNATGGPAPTYTLTTAPDSMTIDEGSGVISWLPNVTGDVSVTVKATNERGENSQDFIIDIAGIPPVITSSAQTNGMVFQPYSYDVNALGEPAPTYMLTTHPPSMTINAQTGLISWLPDKSGVFSVTVKATNEEGATTQNFNLNIAGIAPTITSNPSLTTTVGFTYTYDVETIAEPTPVFTLTQAPPGMIIDTVSGLITWQPAVSGVVSVTVEASNIEGEDSQDFDLNIVAVNHDPVANPDMYEIDEDESLVVLAEMGVFSNDTDPENNMLTASLVGPSPPGTLILNKDGSFEYSPEPNFHGSVNFNYEANDGNGASDTSTVAITIHAINDPPIPASSIPNQTTAAGELFTLQIASNVFTDVDQGDTLTYTAQLASGTPLPQWITFDAATRTFQGTAEMSDVGTIVIKVIATDAALSSAEQVFDLTIEAISDATAIYLPLLLR